MATELRKIPMMNKNKMVAPITTADAVIYENADESINNELESKTVQGAVDYVIEHSILGEDVENKFRLFSYTGGNGGGGAVFYISNEVYAKDVDEAQQLFDFIKSNRGYTTDKNDRIMFNSSDEDIIIHISSAYTAYARIPIRKYGKKYNDMYEQFVFLYEHRTEDNSYVYEYAIILEDSSIIFVPESNISDIDFKKIPIRCVFAGEVIH